METDGCGGGQVQTETGRAGTEAGTEAGTGTRTEVHGVETGDTAWSKNVF
jgi:hypothetical protein